jgi:alcohol dehydrogenase (cytochrome c)
MGKLLAGVCVTALALGGATAWADEVTPERLLNAGTDAEAGNWLMVGKTYNSNRFSTLNDINASNVAGLHVVTAAPIGGTEPGGFGVGAVETTPLADNGFLYVSDPWGTPYKFDVSDGKTAKLVWTCDTGVDKDPSTGLLITHRGLALAGNKVIAGLFNGHVVACDSETGDVVWDKQVGKEGEGFIAAPLVVGDKVLVSQS